MIYYCVLPEKLLHLNLILALEGPSKKKKKKKKEYKWKKVCWGLSKELMYLC